MRLFIAATFPRDVLRDLNERIARLRPKLPPASWVREETQHLTFAFLAEQSESFVTTIAPALEDSLRTIRPFSARLRGCGFFPNSRRARVGWIGLDPETPFSEVAQRIRGMVARHGVQLDGEFRPHLTLMRLREGWPPASTDLFCRTLESYESQEFQVSSVTLYSSRLDPKGAIHTPLRELPLPG